MEKRNMPERLTRQGQKEAGKNRSREERLRERIRLFQMGLWVGLILIQMLVVENMKIYAWAWQESRGPGEEDITMYSGLYYQKEDCPEPEESYQDEKGQVYTRISWEREEVRIPQETRPVVREGIYRQAEELTQLPETITIKAEREGQQTEVCCFLEEKRVIREEWQEGFTFPVTYHKYDADFYWLGDCLIERGGEKPQLDGCEHLLLEEIGVTPECYRIEEIWWDGFPYEDESGELCRKAVARGQKLLRDYRLVYRGTAVFPAHKAWRVKTVYRPGSEKKRPEETGETESRQVVAPLEEMLPATRAASEFPGFWQRITRILLVTIALGALLFFGGLLLLAVRWGIQVFLPYGRKKQDQRKR